MTQRRFSFLAFCFMLSALWGCGSTQEQMITATSPQQIPNVRIMVADVSNNTGKLFDVDVIGMLWNSLDQSLQNRGILWTRKSPISPLKLEAHVVEYQKGSALSRCLFPMWGKTVLAVKCDLKQGDQVIATAESKETFSIGSGTFTIGAWKKVFTRVADDLVNKLTRSI